MLMKAAVEAVAGEGEYGRVMQRDRLLWRNRRGIEED